MLEGLQTDKRRLGDHVPASVRTPQTSSLSCSLHSVLNYLNYQSSRRSWAKTTRSAAQQRETCCSPPFTPRPWKLFAPRACKQSGHSLSHESGAAASSVNWWKRLWKLIKIRPDREMATEPETGPFLLVPFNREAQARNPVPASVTEDTEN